MSRTLTLNGLIVACLDGKRAYQIAGQLALEADARKLLIALSRRRAGFVRELGEAVRTLGGSPARYGSLAGTLRNVGHATWRSVAGTSHEGDLYRDCASVEAGILARYTHAIRAEWLASTDALLRAQAAEIEIDHDRMRALRGQH